MMEVIIPEIEAGISGIYKFTINDRYVYIGSTCDLFRRFNMHLTEMRIGRSNKLVSNQISEGIGKIKFEILELVEDASMLTDIEYQYIEDCQNKQYLLNVKLTKEGKRQFSASLNNVLIQDIKRIQKEDGIDSFSKTIDLLLKEGLELRKFKYAS